MPVACAYSLGNRLFPVPEIPESTTSGEMSSALSPVWKALMVLSWKTMELSFSCFLNSSMKLSSLSRILFLELCRLMENSGFMSRSFHMVSSCLSFDCSMMVMASLRPFLRPSSVAFWVSSALFLASSTELDCLSCSPSFFHRSRCSIAALRSASS
ncbi:hypothetical protein SDC9_87241 [bioreactor metagenome]|uniref:Uncharacterized protein n=1 Tax=bioreactor metagenome TaxID=1076179 RepID=A0A644ZIP3_9ZZZZ